jgi:hypothetical protein
MNTWLGSHRRLRVTMLVLAAAVVGYGAWQASRWKSRVLVAANGSPAIYRVVHHDRSQSIEAFDWISEKRWSITKNEQDFFFDDIERTLRVSADGKTVVWCLGLQGFMANVHPPHNRRACKLPFDRPEHKLIGISPDARFAVFQASGERIAIGGGKTKIELMQFLTGRNERVSVLSVVDLQPGDLVSSRTWKSTMQESNGEFESFGFGGVETESEPHQGRWKLSAKGEWELIENPSGTWGDFRLRRRDLWTLSDPLEHFLPVPFSAMTNQCHTSDAKTMVFSDVRDDITALDVKTAKVIAQETSGSSRRLHLLGVGIVLIVYALICFGMALWEKQTSWGLFDALLATLLLQSAILPLASAVDSLYPRVAGRPDFFYLVPIFLLRGGLFGAAILVGWWWVHGRPWFGMRWLLGTLWLSAAAIPVLAREVRYEPETLLRAWIGIGLLVSGLTTIVVAPFWWLGWSVRDSSEEAAPWRYGLLHLFVLIAAAAITVVLIQALYETSKLGMIVESFGAIVFGIPLVGLLFLRSRLTAALVIVPLLITAVFASSLYIDVIGRMFFAGPRSDLYVGKAACAVSAAVTIVIPCLVLRWRGWAWTDLRPEIRFVEATP